MALPDSATAEIATALRRLGDRAPPRFDARDFRLPRTAPFLAAVARELEQGRGLVRLTGLDSACCGHAEPRKIFWDLIPAARVLDSCRAAEWPPRPVPRSQGNRRFPPGD